MIDYPLRRNAVRRHRLATGIIACLASFGASLAIHAPAAGAATTLTTCYGHTPTITGTVDTGETIEGTTGDDVIVAGAGDDVIYGNGGHDIICAGAGNDLVTGGDHDFITNGDDGSKITGEDGDDIIVTGTGTDYIDGGRGTDQCIGGGQAADRIYGCTYPTQFVVGQSAPDLIARTAFDNRFRLANLVGQNVMIDFSALWCGPSSSMARATANVQKNIRAAGIPFTYVLGEVQDIAAQPSVRRNAELMSETFSMSQLPVLHAEGTDTSQLTTAAYEFDAENIAYDPGDGTNDFFPTLVFINAAGIVTDVQAGALTGQEIEDHYKTGLPAPADVTTTTPSHVGSDIEGERSFVDALTITATAKQTLEGQLTNALHALDLWLKPKTSACSWMKQFDSTLAKTPGIGSADRADLVSGSQNIKSKLGCSKK